MEATIRALGSGLRGLGAAVDAMGVAMQGKYAHIEKLLPKTSALALGSAAPAVAPSAWVAPNAVVAGAVSIGARSSVWYGATLRGDVNHITIGERTNIQDKVVVHVARNNPSGTVLPTIIGDNVTVGHGATLHACTVENNAFVGMGSTVMDGATVSTNAIVAAGALITPGTTVPGGQVWAGSPAKYLRDVAPEEVAFMAQSAVNYAELADVHAAENSKNLAAKVQDDLNREDRANRDQDYDDHLGIARDPETREILATPHTYAKIGH